jgi:hypothetical protein
MKAVIDRFEGDLAVIILGDEDQRLNVPRNLLPPKAKEGSWLQLDIVGGQPRNIKLDEKETEDARQRISDKLAHLRKGDYNKLP